MVSGTGIEVICAEILVYLMADISFGSNYQDARNLFTDTMALFHSGNMVRISVINFLGLEGFNSLEQEYFKLSFGGNFPHYHNLTLPV